MHVKVLPANDLCQILSIITRTQCIHFTFVLTGTYFLELLQFWLCPPEENFWGLLEQARWLTAVYVT